MPVTVFFEGAKPEEAAGREKLLARAAQLGLGRFSRRQVNLVFTGGPGIRKLNRRFLGKDRLTDVIAFNLPPPRRPASRGARSTSACRSRPGRPGPWGIRC